MLKPFRRHVLSCFHRGKGRIWRKCSCPIWVEGRIDGLRVRRSLDTANWEIANDKILEMEAGKRKKTVSVTNATEEYIQDCRNRALSAETIKKHEQILNPLTTFCEHRGISQLRALDVEIARKFVQSWTDGAVTRSKKLERLRSFFAFCQDNGWLDSNPAKRIKKPQTGETAVVPFTAEQWQLIVKALDSYPERNSFGYNNRKRVGAFVLTLRYTGLRISDVVKLQPHRITDGRILIRTLKTGAAVHLPLPPFVVDAIAAVKNGRDYYFWSGNGELRSATKDWQRSIRSLFTLAKVKGHPHMFRHTLAIELLESGVLVEHVAAILGNSPSIIYKHYAPWIPSRQKALDEAVMRIWSR